uniref:Uncharacterized protein n=1 Tax=Knipowitschia caucasica TaxID=637954 RepID=A0AAV2JHQ6_KNICA
MSAHPSVMLLGAEEKVQEQLRHSPVELTCTSASLHCHNTPLSAKCAPVQTRATATHQTRPLTSGRSTCRGGTGRLRHQLHHTQRECIFRGLKYATLLVPTAIGNLPQKLAFLELWPEG